MAKKVKNPDQGFLFEIAPEPKKSVRKTVEVKFTPTIKEITMAVIHYNEQGVEVSHAFCPQSGVDRHIAFNDDFFKQKKKKRTYKVMSEHDYWIDWHAGKLKLGH